MISSILQHKAFLIASSIAVPLIATTAIVAGTNDQSDQKPIIEKKVEFAFDDEFFGEPEPPVTIETLPFIAAKVEEAPKPQIKYIEIPAKPKRARISFLNSSIIQYSENEDNGVEAFLVDNKKDNPSSIASKAYDLSRVITTNKVIPVVLETAINTEIATKGITANVESDVYGYHPKDVLIPRVSKLEGQFEAIQNKNARRIQLSWYKITTPEGRIIQLDATTMDSYGSSGATGDVDSRLKDRYGGAFLFSGINALANLSVDVENARNLALAQSLTRDFSSLSAQIVREKLDIRPIIKIRQGERFNIKPHKNILFRSSRGGQSIKAIFVK